MQYALIPYNNSIHGSTNFTPYEMTFGHTNSRDPCELITSSFYSDYVLTHRGKLEHLYKDLQKN